MSFLVQIGDSLREAFFMLWQTLWALILGFTLSGLIQAFVSRERMQSALGRRNPAAILRATLFGMASSSCSYAAAAMGRSLFKRGADFVTSLIFTVASTNLVIELGVVLLLLIGWQFTAAEFVGGAVMVLLLALIASLAFPARVTSLARVYAGDNVVHEHGGGSAATPSFVARLATAATYTVSDLKMVRRELVLGFGIAGFLAVLVPSAFWRSVFVPGNGVWTSVENALIGPLVAIISFVCSIGNVPLAAALWKGGISFGGVVAFIFADLITFPLLSIYRKYYGWKMAARMLVALWLVMSVTGLIVETGFHAVGLVPTNRPTQISPERFALNYTMILNVMFIAVLGGVFYLYRRRDRFAPSVATHAIDPVCGMQVEVAHAPAHAVIDGTDYYFCCEGCRDTFTAQNVTPRVTRPLPLRLGP